ncbi:MAG: thioredoxin-dependent thiol peroxidase [Verrucomicrobiota bacterium]
MAIPEPLKPGDPAPHFTVEEDGLAIDSKSLKGPCLVYFYPKDDTPGCTKEACGLRDAWASYEKAGVQVIGVSGDSETSHQKFRNKYELPFPLIADTELTLAHAFGVYGEKKFMGRVYDGIHRMSFLIGKDGKILKTYTKVKPEAHAKQVLEDLSLLTAS